MLGAEIDSLALIGLKEKMKEFGLGEVKLEIQQGLSQDTKGAAVLGTIHNSIEANSEAVGRLFEELDSLKNEGLANRMADSLQVRLGKEIKQNMPDLLSFRLSRISFFDAAKNTAKSGWEATCRFSKNHNDLEINKLREILKLQLPGDTLLFTISK